MGNKKPVKYKKFTDENVETIKAKKLQEKAHQDQSHSKYSASNLKSKPGEPQSEKSKNSRSVHEQRNHTEIKLPEDVNKVKNQIKPPKETSVSKIKQIHHNVDEPHANEQITIESDDKANLVDNKVLEPKLTEFAQNDNIHKDLSIIDTLEDTTVEVSQSHNISCTNMKPRTKDMQVSKPQPDNPAWTSSSTFSPPSTGHPFSYLNPNATAFQPGESRDPPQSNIGYPVQNTNLPLTMEKTVNITPHHIMPPGMVLQPTCTSIQSVSQHFPPRPFNNSPNSSQEEPSILPVENTYQIETSRATRTVPVPDHKNSTIPWKIEHITPNHHPAQRNIEEPLQSSQGSLKTTYAQDPALLPQPSSHNAPVESVHELPNPKSSVSNRSDEEYVEPNYPQLDKRSYFDNKSDLPRNHRNNFDKDNATSRNVQDRKGGKGGGRRLNENKEDGRGGRGGRGGGKHFNKDDQFGRRNEKLKVSSQDSKERHSGTEEGHDGINKYDDVNRNKNWTTRPSDYFDSRGGRGRSPDNDAHQNRGYQNRDNGPQSRSNRSVKDPDCASLEKKANSSDKDCDARHEFKDSVEIEKRASEDRGNHENRNKAEISWRVRTNDEENKYFKKNRDGKYRDRDNRTRDTVGNLRGESAEQSRRDHKLNFGRGASGKGTGNGRGRYNSNKYQNAGEFRRSSVNAIEIVNDDSSKDSSDNYHITDEDSCDIPEKSVEVMMESHDYNVALDDWNDSVDIAAETTLEQCDWNTLHSDDVLKPKTQNSIENNFEEDTKQEEKKEDAAPSMPKRKLDLPNLERGTSKHPSSRKNEEWESAKTRRSYDKGKPSDPRMDREKLNKRTDSASFGPASSTRTRSSEPSSKQTPSTFLQDDFDRWERTWLKIKDFHVLTEIQGNLFEQPKDFSLAHCVAEDLRMGSGIAVEFKREFKNVDELLDQRAKQGGLATLYDKATNRYVYYLVTKRESTGKPTYLTLWRALSKMRDHIKENKVKKLAIPRLGCGLDRLEWNKVKSMLEFLFQEVDVEITVCNFQQDEEAPKKSWSTNKVVYNESPVTKIEPGTLIFYFTTENGDVDADMHELSKKFNFLMNFKNHKSKNLGEIVYSGDQQYGLCGCVVRKNARDNFSFKSLLKCIREFNKFNRKFGNDAFHYVAFQSVNEREYFDDLINQKIITLFINFLKDVDVYVCSGSFGHDRK